ncbi:MAG: gamma-glutamyltransferase, partial [Bradyrhizobium sp.]|nr:gamma-glutamyltransferase [Bradyrhizobium sp.]
MVSFTAERRSLFAAIALVVALGLPAAAQERREYIPAGAGHAVSAEHGMVVAQEKIGARIGADILRQGGNAVDAAVATGFALAVTYPRAGNIGGGGF